MTGEPMVPVLRPVKQCYVIATSIIGERVIPWATLLVCIAKNGGYTEVHLPVACFQKPVYRRIGQF